MWVPMTPLPPNFFKNDCKNGFNFKIFLLPAWLLVFALMQWDRDDLFFGDHDEFLFPIGSIDLQTSDGVPIGEYLDVLNDHCLHLWPLTFIDHLENPTII